MHNKVNQLKQSNKHGDKGYWFVNINRVLNVFEFYLIMQPMTMSQ